MTQVPLPRTLPPAQKVFEYTSRVRSEVQAVSNIYTCMNGSLLTFVRLNVILGGPCGMGAVRAVNGDRVVFCLVNDIDLLVITQEHLTAVMSIFSGIRFDNRLTCCALTPVSPTLSKLSGVGAFDEPRLLAVYPGVAPSCGEGEATTSDKNGRSVRRVTMFSEAMAD